MSRKDIRETTDAERELETIFSLVGPREKPPEFLERKVREAVRSEWRRVTALRRPKVFRAYFAVAAALVLAVAAVLVMQQQGRSTKVFAPATVARIAGTVTLNPGSQSTALARRASFVIRHGDTLQSSADGGVSLALAAGRQLRLGAASRVRFSSDEMILLETGRIYLDSGESIDSSAPITIVTELGKVRHVGTRFQVHLARESMRVVVRDGTVAVTSESGADTLAHAGQTLSMTRNGNASISDSGGSGVYWLWVDALATPMAIEGRSLFEVLSWAAEESGCELRFTDVGLERAARETTLHGALVLEQPLEDLGKVMMTTSMEFALRGNSILVSSKR